MYKLLKCFYLKKKIFVQKRFCLREKHHYNAISS